jgi:hypothetical protein
VQQLLRFFRVDERAWRLDTPNTAEDARRRLADRSSDPRGEWTPLRRAADRQGRPYFTAASADPISAIQAFPERFTLDVHDARVEVRSRPHPVVRIGVPLFVILLLVAAVAALVGWPGSLGDRLAIAATCVVTAFALLGLVRFRRQADERRMRRWLTSILDDQPW